MLKTLPIIMEKSLHKANKILVLLALMAILAGFLLSSTLSYLFRREMGNGEVQLFIPPGATLREVSKLLYERQVISSPLYFELWARILGYQRQIKPGDYEIKRGTTPLSLLKTLVSLGRQGELITIPEGWQAAQIAQLLELRGICKASDFLLAIKESRILNDLKVEGGSLEGYLFPDTYRMLKDTPAHKVVRLMAENFFRKTQELLSEGWKKGLSTRDIVVLASLVEKEARLPHERRLVAGVFFNRLKRGMKLQSDPSSIYDPDGISPRRVEKR
ncbi:MAG: endolytic transglycosylase MltG, partial [Desulfatiglandales bacterium]